MPVGRGQQFVEGSAFTHPGRKTPAFLGRTFRRLEGRLGRKKAAMAVAHKLLVLLYHLLMDGTFYDESRYDRQDAREEERRRKRALAALESLGYHVILSPGS